MENSAGSFEKLAEVDGHGMSLPGGTAGWVLRGLATVGLNSRARRILVLRLVLSGSPPFSRAGWLRPFLCVALAGTGKGGDHTGPI